MVFLFLYFSKIPKMPLVSRCYVRKMGNVMTVHFHPLFAKAIFPLETLSKSGQLRMEEK